ncbi:MAG: phospho-N-acetylmuramoyl-pentapeptide-transferase [bacterium]
MQNIQDPILVFDVAKVMLMAALAFIFTISWTPLLTKYLYKYKLGKRIRTEGAPVYSKMHQGKSGTPVMGGLLIWVTTLIFALCFWFVSIIFKGDILDRINFLSRGQTLLPLGALVTAGIVGLIDDLFNVFGIGPKGGGLKMGQKLIVYLSIAAFGAYWFFYKLNWDLIHIPGLGDYNIGWYYIPLFIFVIVATSFSVNETDGLDGLAGGVLLMSYLSYAVICFVQGKVDLAVFCAVIVGALLAFLWFNIYPARFFMGDTGAMALGTTLGIIAMLTNTVFVLPIIAFPLVIESGSVILQVLSKTIFGKKIFISTPIHHHFEAQGWPETKVTMRFWVLSIVFATIGLVIALIGAG